MSLPILRIILPNWEERYVFQVFFFAILADASVQTPIVIFDDADLEMAINGAAFAAFVASGQTCVSGTRILVQDAIYDKFMSGFVEKTKSITQRMGDRKCSLVAYTLMKIIMNCIQH